MPSLWFIVPAHGRLSLSAICLRQLRRTCDSLIEEGIEATAVVIGNDRNLDTGRELDFGTVRRDNKFLGRKFNDGIQLACDPAYNPRPADFVMPFGSDDFIDYRAILGAFQGSPRWRTITAFNTIALVRPDGKEMSARILENRGGAGLRIYPHEIVARSNYRPADEDRSKGCDTSILHNLGKTGQFHITYQPIDPRQIVDWKSEKVQVTPYESVSWRRRAREWADPFYALEGFYPAEALNEMRALY